MATADRKAVIVGISGCSSSGKTTLARLLRDIFPNTFILHEDDFYLSDKDIPVGVDGLADWDCPESLSVSDMTKALAYIRSHGGPPVSLNPSLTHRADHGHGGLGRRDVAFTSSASPFPPHSAPPATCLPLPPPPPPPPQPKPLESSPLTPLQPDQFTQEDQNSVGPCPVSDATIDAMKAKVAAWLEPGRPGHKLITAESAVRICFFDGFLLYCTELRPAMDLIDVRLFLRVSRAKATQRRQARDGYVTLEGFWQDPPGYVDKIVWPNYVRTHKWLFEGGDVEGAPDKKVLEAEGILTQLDQGTDVDFATTLAWAVDTLMRVLEEKYL